MPLKLLLNGSRGRMGQAVSAIAQENDAEIFAACDRGEAPGEQISECEAIIDFSSHEATAGIARMAVANRIPLIIGTTGHSAGEKRRILETVEGQIAVVWAGNYSVGVNTLNYLTRKAAHILGASYETEVLEMHHRHKKDAPSGTATRLVEILKEIHRLDDHSIVYGRRGLTGPRPSREIGVHALRGGSIVGEHTVHFICEGERIELTHKADDRRIFARGSVRAAHWAVQQPSGVYNMEDVLGLTE